MKVLVAAVLMTALLGSGAAHAQSQLDHTVQKTWDNLVNPGPPGDPRTNWERREDHRDARDARFDTDRRREAEHAEWCRYHPGGEGCVRPYGYGGPPGYGR